MKSHRLSPDTQAILLLCASFGPSPTADVKPLSLREYNDLGHWLRRNGMRPADLLEPEGLGRLQKIDVPGMEFDRLLWLIQRGTALALAVESWSNKGLWVISRVDDAYPQRLKDRLKSLAPPILFGAGNQNLLSAGGVAIVGSRDIDEDAAVFANTFASTCARQGIQVVSGGARGIDIEAMEGAYRHGGSVIGVLANALAQAAASKKYREPLMQGALVLISPVHPNSAFNIGNAMSRNKYIYALSDWALVVSSSFNKGGTWTGAVENLKHGWVPLFVRSGANAPEGNRRLIGQGGISVSAQFLVEELRLRDWLAECSGQLVLRDDKEPEATPSGKAEVETIELRTAGQTSTAEQMAAVDSVTAPSSRDPFYTVWPHIEQKLDTPRTTKELAEIFSVTQKQMNDWLGQAVRLAKVTKLSKPVRFITPGHYEKGTSGGQLSLPLTTGGKKKLPPGDEGKVRVETP
ncbi:MAG: DNA-protecting protein DprA [Deltaproteobacteria bacterium]|nr:DNA-protecting protein DprA [Deltaproteobacteria bacterium]